MRTKRRVTLPSLLAFALAAAAFAAVDYDVKTLPIPGASGAVLMDYIAFDPDTKFVWVPAGNTAQIVVIDTASGSVKPISGLPTAEMGSGDRKRLVGPSSVSIGGGEAYVGNRADSSICAFDARSLAKGACRKLDAMPDGVAYVGGANEVWVTTPRDKSIRVLDATSLEEKAKITLDGSPEGFAVDSAHGRFYTNLEDKDRTLAIDVATRKTAETWNPNCGEEGPRGLRVDSAAQQLFVACTQRAEVLDTAHGGKVLSSIDTGEGVDDLDYDRSRHLLYVGAAHAAKLTVARVDADGKLTLDAQVATRPGARNPAVTDRGVVYLTHGSGGELVVATPKK